MIYGYIIIAPGGSLITYRMHEEKYRKKMDASLLSNGIYALHTFFTEVLGKKLEEVIGVDYKIVIHEEKNVIFALLADISDNNAKILAKKYSKKLVKRFIDRSIVNFDLVDYVNENINDILDELDEEIRDINERLSKIRYV